MENSVWNQKYANEIKSKLDIAGKKGHLIANKNSERETKEKGWPKAKGQGISELWGQQQTAWSPFNWGPRKLGENRKKKKKFKLCAAEASTEKNLKK